MSRGSRTQMRLQNQIKDRRGQGTGNNYTFIQAHDNKVASKGWVTRHLGWKTRRIHHTLNMKEGIYIFQNGLMK